MPGPLARESKVFTSRPTGPLTPSVEHERVRPRRRLLGDGDGPDTDIFLSEVVLVALGDGIRRNIASVEPAERAMLRDALIELNTRVYPGSRSDSVPGGVTW